MSNRRRVRAHTKPRKGFWCYIGYHEWYLEEARPLKFDKYCVKCMCKDDWSLSDVLGYYPTIREDYERDPKSVVGEVD